jgi:hypothetical protein
MNDHPIFHPPIGILLTDGTTAARPGSVEVIGRVALSSAARRGWVWLSSGVRPAGHRGVEWLWRGMPNAQRCAALPSTLIGRVEQGAAYGARRHRHGSAQAVRHDRDHQPADLIQAAKIRWRIEHDYRDLKTGSA